MSSHRNKVSKLEAQKKLLESAGEFAGLFRLGSLEKEYYQPDKQGKQQPHTRDEVYIIAEGSGNF